MRAAQSPILANPQFEVKPQQQSTALRNAQRQSAFA
jgi:hypothetical protein